MPLCRVKDCTTNSGQGIPMHRFPYVKHPERARQWLIKCKIAFGEKALDIYQYQFKHKMICGRHFAPDAYRLDYTSKELVLSKELRDDAMPTLHLPIVPVTPVASPANAAASHFHSETTPSPTPRPSGHRDHKSHLGEDGSTPKTGGRARETSQIRIEEQDRKRLLYNLVPGLEELHAPKKKKRRRKKKAPSTISVCPETSVTELPTSTVVNTTCESPMATTVTDSTILASRAAVADDSIHLSLAADVEDFNNEPHILAVDECTLKASTILASDTVGVTESIHLSPAVTVEDSSHEPRILAVEEPVMFTVQTQDNSSVNLQQPTQPVQNTQSILPASQEASVRKPHTAASEDSVQTQGRNVMNLQQPIQPAGVLPLTGSGALASVIKSSRHHKQLHDIPMFLTRNVSTQTAPPVQSSSTQTQAFPFTQTETASSAPTAKRTKGTKQTKGTKGTKQTKGTKGTKQTELLLINEIPSCSHQEPAIEIEPQSVSIEPTAAPDETTAAPDVPTAPPDVPTAAPVELTAAPEQPVETPVEPSPGRIKKDHPYFSKKHSKAKKKVVYKEDPVESDHEEEDNTAKDPTYEPNSSSGDESSDDEEVTSDNAKAEGYVGEKKYIVFESCLRKLFAQTRCKEEGCTKVFEVDEECELGRMSGSLLTMKVRCLEGHTWQWQSQPLIGEGASAVGAGNILISAAALFSGSIWGKLKQFADFMNLKFIGESTHGQIQGDFAFPVVHEAWSRQQDTLWTSLEGKVVKLSGDGRCDSPGYSAKYLTYAMLDMDTGNVVDIHTVHVSETTSSNAMEKLACTRMLEKLSTETNFEIGILCTDRHIGIKAMMEKDYPNIDHQVDVWHLQKSVGKKLNAKAKKSDCKELLPWIPSITNHLWYSASTCGGDKDTLMERWRSISHHVTNKHEWGGYVTVNACGHEPLPEEVARRKKWIEEDSPAHEALVAVVEDKSILAGVKKVNKFCHTGTAENFNGMLTKYAPKRLHYKYEPMTVRTRLAALDHNHNTGRQQARVRRKTKSSGAVGTLRYKVVCPKFKKAWIAKAIYEKKTYEFVYDLMAEAVKRKLENRRGTDPAFFSEPNLPPNLAPASLPPVDRAAVLRDHRTRFGHLTV